MGNDRSCPSVVFEAARRQGGKELASVYMVLGDIGMETGMFDQAKQDYEKSLELRKTLNDKSLMADAHCCLAMASVYQGSAVEDADKKKSVVKEGLDHYIRAGRLMAEICHERALDEETRKILLEAIPLSDQLSMTMTQQELQEKIKGQANAQGLNDAIEIYIELKEKAEGLRTSLAIPAKADAAGFSAENKENGSATCLPVRKKPKTS